MGTFEFVILIVLISTFGKVVAQRGARLPPAPPTDQPRLSPPELQELRDTLDRMDERLARIEEERDFYRQLLEDPGRDRPRGAPDA